MADEYNEDYYKLLKQQNYDALLNKEVQLDNARRRALKNTNTNLASMGLASSGYGQTALSGVENQYLQALGNANQAYQEENTKIGLEEQNAIASQRNLDYQTFSSVLTDAYDRGEQDFYNTLSDKGLYADGNFNYDKAVELYGKNNADLLYSAFKSGVSDFENNKVVANDYQTASNTFVDQNGKTGKFNDELGVLFDSDMLNAFGYKPKEGDCIKISANSDKNASTAYLVYQNGRWVQADITAYNNATNKHWLRSAKNSGYKYYFDNNSHTFDNDFMKWAKGTNTYKVAYNTEKAKFKTAKDIGKAAGKGYKSFQDFVKKYIYNGK